MTVPALPWLTILGIGEDGLAGLSPAARALIADAQILAGGERHLALVPPDPKQDRLPWGTPFSESIEKLKSLRGRRVTVLASGDPMWFGIGATLSRHFPAAEMRVYPHPGAFSLAAARLCWRLHECETLSIHGRPIEAVKAFLAPGVRLLFLCEDGSSPAKIALLLKSMGFGPSRLTALAHLGGPREIRREDTAENWRDSQPEDLVTLAVECRAEPGALWHSRSAGLPDDAFENDGQLTKREARAATLAALQPFPGATLWDIGAGCGSIAIEWMRAARDAEAVAVEKESKRAALIGRNALQLGVPRLRIVTAAAPACFAELQGSPDAVFVGGAASVPGTIEGAFAALKPGGRLVVNAVTAEAEARLLAWHKEKGGEMVRIAVSRLEPLGGHHAWRPLAPVTQYRLVKP